MVAYRPVSPPASHPKLVVVLHALGGVFGTINNDIALGMLKRHDAGFPDQFWDVGTFENPDHGYVNGHYKMLVSPG